MRKNVQWSHTKEKKDFEIFYFSASMQNFGLFLPDFGLLFSEEHEIITSFAIDYSQFLKIFLVSFM